MKYRNKVTGATFETNFKISGENWEQVKEKAKPKKESDGE